MTTSLTDTDSFDTARIQAARELYGIDRWGREYFDISSRGNVVVKAPTAKGPQVIELTEIIRGLKGRGLPMPVMLRFENLVDQRIDQLHSAFNLAIRQTGYGNGYRGVFPIKVNQQRHVIREVARAGRAWNFGFEAGSKAELLIALASWNGGDSLVICNGYKDEEFVDLALQSLRLGIGCFLVIETPQELKLILERARHWNVDPLLGVRLKLSTTVAGHWSSDSGDRSLFGLSTRQLIEIVDTLKEHDRLHCLQMLHFHQGSQIPDIRNVRDGVHEACRYYVELIREGAPMGYFNLGGGLAVDYDGSQTSGANSRNYDLDEYCVDIVEAIIESLEPFQVDHPMIVSESGRWVVAPISVLLFNILSVSHFDPEPISEPVQGEPCEPVLNLLDTLQHIETRRLQENYNDVVYYRDRLRRAFRQGEICLREKAFGENICLTILKRIAELVPQLSRPSPDLLAIQDQWSDIYYGNFSIFQSLPDAWAIDQLFPVMPLHRLAEPPTRNAIIADLTCDCDGKLDQFVSRDGQVARLKLHEWVPGQEYYLGVFLVGAYQETLADLHNLFGDTHVASVRVTPEGQLEFVREIHGDSIADVLQLVEHQPDELYQQFREIAESAVRADQISVEERKQLLNLFTSSLGGYTYFESG